MIVAGLGLRGSATRDSLRDALARALQAAGLDGVHCVSLLATPRDKLGADGLVRLARELGVALVGVDREWLRAAPTLTDHGFVRAVRGSGSPAEAAALIGVQLRGAPGARLLGPRSVSADARATCALATSAPAGANPP